MGRTTPRDQAGIGALTATSARKMSTTAPTWFPLVPPRTQHQAGDDEWYDWLVWHSLLAFLAYCIRQD
jgi:hypothetical protein